MNSRGVVLARHSRGINSDDAERRRPTLPAQKAFAMPTMMRPWQFRVLRQPWMSTLVSV